MCKIKVLKSGLCTTIQDIGRVGFQEYGIPVSGVMDEYSFYLANYLVEANKNNAVLEIPYIGPSLEFDFDISIAITGADLTPKINGVEIKLWETINIKKGDILSFHSIKKGARAYIAFAGEINVPLINGSKSTLLKSKLGGYDGRQLKIGDEIEILNPRVLARKNKISYKYLPSYKNFQEIRVVLGPQDDYFTEKGIKTLFETKYEITKNSDRMGMRLEGKIIEHKDKADIISDAAVFGSIQVPANGQPIILLADRQTTGGYTKIATIIKADLPKLAQLSPKDTIKFKKLNLEEAEEEYIKYYNLLDEIKESILNPKEKKYSISKDLIEKKLFGKRKN